MDELLDFKNYFYRSIGNRVRNYRKRMGLTQEGFIAQLQIQKDVSIDRSLLSHVENGRVYKKKNPYLLTEDQILSISQLIKETPQAVIFGNQTEKENTVKSILLAIILNGAKYEESRLIKGFINPFIDTNILQTKFKKTINNHCKELKGTIEGNNRKELEKSSVIELKEFISFCRYFIRNEWKDRIFFLHSISEEWLLEEITDEELKKYVKWFEQNFPYFSSGENFKSINYLLSESDKSLERSSNLLIKLLVGNYHFAKMFMDSLSNLNQYKMGFSEETLEELSLTIVGFIENIGRFGEIAIGFKDDRYSFFVTAFNEMWTRNGETFMNYFNDNLFSIDLNHYGLKKIDNSLVHNLITSSEFSEMLLTRIEREKYGLDTMKGHNTFDLYLQKMMILNTFGIEEVSKKNLFEYIDRMIIVNLSLIHI